MLKFYCYCKSKR